MKSLYSVFDRKAQAFTHPVLMIFEKDDLAFRAVKTAANSKQLGELIDRYPEDFELWRLGTFDEVQGDLAIEKQCICNFADFQEVAKNG